MLAQILHYMNTAFTCLFALEAGMKIYACGFRVSLGSKKLINYSLPKYFEHYFVRSHGYKIEVCFHNGGTTFGTTI